MVQKRWNRVIKKQEGIICGLLKPVSGPVREFFWQPIRKEPLPQEKPKAAGGTMLRDSGGKSKQFCRKRFRRMWNPLPERCFWEIRPASVMK